jgi:hypothetical protein
LKLGAIIGKLSNQILESGGIFPIDILGLLISNTLRIGTFAQTYANIIFKNIYEF